MFVTFVKESLISRLSNDLKTFNEEHKSPSKSNLVFQDLFTFLGDAAILEKDPKRPHTEIICLHLFSPDESNAKLQPLLTRIRWPPDNYLPERLQIVQLNNIFTTHLITLNE